MVDAEVAPLRKLVFGWTVPDETVARLRARYPSIQFVVATGSDLVIEIADADAVVAWSLTEAEFTAAGRLRWFQTIGAGVERALLPAMVQQRLLVTNMSGIHATNIAEHVLAMMLAFARRLPFLIRGQVNHEWRDDEGRRGVFELAGQSLLVVGYGAIGRSLATKARALGMTVRAVRRTSGPAKDDGIDVRPLNSLHEMVGSADHIAICLPQTIETVRLFDATMFSVCKPGAFIYNIGRGPIIDTDALVMALESGLIGGAGLDVSDPEPLPSDSPLWDRDNVIITSHTAGSTPYFWDRIENVLVHNIDAYLAGQPLRNVVDHALGY